MGELNSWDKMVVDKILSYKDLKVDEVNNIETIKSGIFNRENYGLIISLIKEKSWEKINNLEDTETTGFREYLDIIKFTDKNKLTHIATIYDSDEMWQDPEVIEIIPLP